MAKVIHVSGIVVGYAIAIAAIIVGTLGAVSGVPGWKFVVFGIALALCATIAIVDGAQAMPSIGWFKAKSKFQGLSDLGFILIFGILLITSLIIFF